MLNKFQKISYLGLIATLTLAPLNVMAQGFSDLDEYSPYFKSVSNFAALGILKGFEDKTFQPNQNVTRAEAVKILSLALDLEVNSERQNELTFTDVPKNQWFYEYVDIALSHDLIKGFPDNTFRPAEPIQVAEMLKIAMKAKKIEIGSSTNTLSLAENAWYKDYANFALDKNFLSLEFTSPQATFEKSISRSETAELLYRIKSSDSGYKYQNDFKEYRLDSGFKLYLPEYFYVRNYSEGLIATAFSGLNLLDGYGFLMEAQMHQHEKMELITNAANLKSKKQLTELYEKQADNFYLLTGTNPQGIYKAFYIRDYNTLEISFKPTLKTREYELNQIRKAIIDSVDVGKVSETQARNRTLEIARQNILKSYKGTETLKKFSDLELFYTDAVGLGTGPVDYYYDKATNHTFKYERSFDVIMDIQQGRGQDF